MGEQGGHLQMCAGPHCLTASSPLGSEHSWIYHPRVQKGRRPGRYARSQAAKGRLQIYQIKMQDPQLNLDF